MEHFYHFALVDKGEYVNTCPIDNLLTSLCYHVTLIDPTFNVPKRSLKADVNAVEKLLNSMVTKIKAFGPQSDAYDLQKMLIKFIQKQPRITVCLENA